MTFVSWFPNLMPTYTIFENLSLHLVLIGNLDNDTRIFHKNFHYIGLFYFVEVNFKTTFYVGKHISNKVVIPSDHRQRMSCPAKGNPLFTSSCTAIKYISEVFGILYTRYFVTYFAKRLCKNRSAQFQCIKTEVDMIKCCFHCLPIPEKPPSLYSDTSPPAETMLFPEK